MGLKIIKSADFIEQAYCQFIFQGWYKISKVRLDQAEAEEVSSDVNHVDLFVTSDVKGFDRNII